ncbi:MAG: hypothetical protein WCO60_17440 [Verrucomicrobiota bacterium]
MPPSSQSLIFTQTPTSLFLALGFVALIAGLAFIAARRSGFRRIVVFLETLRVLIAAAIALTLNQPEWRQIFPPKNNPTLAILSDVSRSMETRDILPPNVLSAEATSRNEAAKALTDPAVWKPATQSMDLVFQTFSSNQTPPEEGSDLNSALLQTLEKQPHLKAVVLLSDGDWNTGDSPTQAATQFRMRGIPVFTVPIGAETRLPDVQLSSFEVPTFAIAGKPLRIPFTIESSLPRDETTTVEMTSSTGDIVSKSVTIPAMGRIQDVLTWKPEKPGDLKLVLKIPKTGEERYLENNSLEAALTIRKEQLRVLVIETVPRWEFRYLRNALERDPGVQVQCLLLHPDLGKPGAGRNYLGAFPKDDELAKYDVVFLGDIGVGKDQLTLEQCTSLHKLVRDQAAGLVFLPGIHGFENTLQSTPLGELFPVVLDENQPRGWGTSTPGRFSLTEAGTRSLLTKLEDTEDANTQIWQNLPGFQWYAPIARAKAGSQILATHDTEANRSGRIPLIVTKTYGAGKILFMGTDGAWRWRKGVEDRYHYRFWGQVVRWMAYQRNMSQGDKMRLFYSPDRPTLGAVLSLNANVTGANGDPLRAGTVVAQISAPSGKTNNVRLTSAGEDSWGLFSGTFTPNEPGEHRVHLTCPEAASTLDTTISIQGTSREKIGQPAKFDVLREIAQLTKGRFLESREPEPLLAAIAALPKLEPEERRIQIWAHPLWAGFIVFLLGTFWVARKSAGSF